MLAADTITDDQIRKLRASGLIGPSAEYFALNSLSVETKYYYRAHCAEIFRAQLAQALDLDR